MAKEGTSTSSVEEKEKVPAAEAAGTPTDAKPTDAPSGTDLKDAKPPTEEDFRNVVRSALKPKEESSTSESKAEKEAPATGDTSDEAADKSEKKDGTAAEDDKLPPFHEHPRWKSLTKERDDLKGKLTSLEPDAQEYRAITGFMKENGLTTKQVTDAFQLLALLNTDPAKGREAMQKSLADLDARLGETLPEDLTAAVKAGEITEDRARELSRARAGEKIAKEEAEARRQQDAERSASEARGKLVEDVKGKVRAWSAVVERTDPDFAKKQKLLSAEVNAILRERGKLLQSPEDAVEVYRSAYASVNAALQSLKPAPAERTFVKAENVGGGGAPAAPKSPLEALRAGLARGQG